MGLKIGVLGVGRLGRIHVRVLSELEGVDLVGCHDRAGERSRAAAAEYGATAFETREALLDAVDAVCVVVPTSDHARLSVKALEGGKDVFVEKPLAAELDQAEAIVDCARTHGRILQVGHSERFNGVLEKARPRIGNPTFIEVHRLAPFSVRGTDVSVVGDLMIHDLDLLYHLLGENPVEIRAKGAGVLTEAPDIVNVRMEYPGGCVANVTASRVSVEPMRKMRVFSPNRYLSIDLQHGRAVEYRKARGFDENIARLRSQADGFESLGLNDFVEFESFESDGGEPLKKELAAFCRSVENRVAPPVTGEDGLNAVRLASEIVDMIQGDGAGPG
jgi:predicted dehydrogenase